MRIAKYFLTPRLLSISYYFYIRTKEHNLNVVNSIRLCGNLDAPESVKDCSVAVKNQFAF